MTTEQIAVYAARECWVRYDAKQFPKTPLRHLRTVCTPDGALVLEVNVNGRYRDMLRRLAK